MQRLDRAVTWAANDFNENMMRLLNVMRKFPAISAISVMLF